MKAKEKYAEKLVKLISKKSNINISKYDMDEVVMGMLVELEHGSENEETNVTNDDPHQTLQIVLAHLNELPDYYTRLKKMEEEDESENKREEMFLKETIRYKELIGVKEHKNKKHLTNEMFLENTTKQKLIKEEIDKSKFDIIEFDLMDIGKEKDEEIKKLYTMEKRENHK